MKKSLRSVVEWKVRACAFRGRLAYEVVRVTRGGHCTISERFAIRELKSEAEAKLAELVELHEAEAKLEEDLSADSPADICNAG